MGVHDTEHVGDLATPVHATRTRHTGAVPSAQTSDELAAQFAPRLGVYRGVDCFVGHVACRVVGEYALEGTADLLRRPTPVKKSENTQPGKAVDVELGFWFGSAPTGLAGLLSNMRAVHLGAGCYRSNCRSERG